MLLVHIVGAAVLHKLVGHFLNSFGGREIPVSVNFAGRIDNPVNHLLFVVGFQNLDCFVESRLNRLCCGFPEDNLLIRAGFHQADEGYIRV